MRMTGFIVLHLVMLVYIPLYTHAGTNVIDRIIAVVNNEIITLSELEKYKSLMSTNTPEQSNPADINRRLLNQMIEKKMIVQEAKELEIEVRERDVDIAVENVLKRNKVSMKEMKEQMTKQGITLEEYRELIKVEILQSQVVSRQVQSAINITDNEIQKYYEQNIKPKEKPGARVRIQQILLTIPHDSTAENITEIEKRTSAIREKIVTGEKFEKMAVTYSQGPAAKMGGDLGYFHKGELLPPIEESAFSLEEGQLSPVIKTNVGFHLIKLIDKKPS